MGSTLSRLHQQNGSGDQQNGERNKAKAVPVAKYLGIKVKTLNTLPNYKDPVSNAATRPEVRGELYTDTRFPCRVAMGNLEPGVEWQRPGKFCEKPVLFGKSTSRLDVCQGGLGDCYLVILLAEIAEKPELLKQIIPKDAYNIGTAEYNGVFHCRFWKYGQWVDVYVDDYLPVSGDKPWGASCPLQPNVMWVALLEKAFAKHVGSYTEAKGGSKEEAFLALTGGVVDSVSHTDATADELQLYKRIRGALKAGQIVCGGVLPKSTAGFGGHAYSITGIAKVSYKGEKTPVVRIRNPWGRPTAEWSEPYQWALEWAAIDSDTWKKNKALSLGRGEFLMTLPDFLGRAEDNIMFGEVVPQVQKRVTGKAMLSMLYGEWRGQTAAGPEGANRFLNQKFVCTVPNTGAKTVQVVMQLMREKQGAGVINKCFMRLNCYKVDAENNSEGHDYLVLEEITNKTEYRGEVVVTYRYSLKPGKYMILPTTSQPRIVAAFCIRLFAAVPISCRALQRTTPYIFEGSQKKEFEHNETKYDCCKSTTCFGEWKRGKNAGGQTAQPSFHTNPQYVLSIQGKEPVPLFVSVKQVNNQSRVPIGFHIFPREEHEVPLNKNTINLDKRLKDVNDKFVFIEGQEGASYYLMTPGSYVVITFTDVRNVEEKFALTLATSKRCKLSLQSFNTA